MTRQEAIEAIVSAFFVISRMTSASDEDRAKLKAKCEEVLKWIREDVPKIDSPDSVNKTENSIADL